MLLLVGPIASEAKNFANAQLESQTRSFGKEQIANELGLGKDTAWEYLLTNALWEKGDLGVTSELWNCFLEQQPQSQYLLGWTALAHTWIKMVA